MQRSLENARRSEVDSNNCIRCGACKRICPMEAISLTSITKVERAAAAEPSARVAP